MKGGDFVFPQTNSDDPNFNRTGRLTKREMFAAAALSNPDITLCAKNGLDGIATVCVKAADALVKALDENARKD